LTNAFWLNTAWGWPFSFYYSYDTTFARFPLELILALLPISAFIGLTLRRSSSAQGRATEYLRGLLVIGVLGVFFLSTGTRPPGNLLFDPLYHLPYGWLLQEPGRFLIVAALGYALLGGLLVDQLEREWPRWRISKRRFYNGRTFALSSSGFTAGAIFLLALSAGFPLWTGAIIPGARDGFPTSHVKVPSDWTATAKYLNSSAAPKGALLVLPPDDFYAMPYTWYYGSDAFIVNLLSRNVVVPSAQSYATVSGELLNAVKLEAADLKRHDWIEAGQLLEAIGTPIILVRGDIEDNFDGRSIVSPADLRSVLRQDPEMAQIHRDQNLSLFELKAKYRLSSNDFATIDGLDPNLRVLALLPRRTVVIDSKPRAGHVALFELSGSKSWRLGTSTLRAQLKVPSGWSYSVSSLDAGAPGGRVSLDQTLPKGRLDATVEVPSGHYVTSDGNFAPDTWGPVGNCYDAKPVKAPQYLRSSTVPDAAPGDAPALQLSASIDAACASKSISWHGGAIQLSLLERTVEGAPAQICVWETPTDRCAAISRVPASGTWNEYRTIVHPTPDTASVTLFLYAYPMSSSEPTTEQYANISAKSLSSYPAMVLVGTPTRPKRMERLIVSSTGYSSEWVASPGSIHVAVDGMRNGWIVHSSDRGTFVVADPTTQRELLEGITLSIAMAALATGLWLVRRRFALAKHRSSSDHR
jgi:hypothetical protein